jgi:hypothetical protein
MPRRATLAPRLLMLGARIVVAIVMIARVGKGGRCRDAG